jgi:hypothetical protein
MSIEQIIKNNRPNVTQQTIKTYTSIIKNIGKKIDEDINNVDDIEKNYNDIEKYLKNIEA